MNVLDGAGRARNVPYLSSTATRDRAEKNSAGIYGETYQKGHRKPQNKKEKEKDIDVPEKPQNAIQRRIGGK